MHTRDVSDGMIAFTRQIFRYSHEAMDGAAKRGLINVLQFLWYQGQLCTTVCTWTSD